MSCNGNNQVSNCGVLTVDNNTAKIFMSIASGIGCGCHGACICGNGLNSTNTWINIRRDGPVYRHNSFGCCGNPAHRVENCPILPGQLSFPYPTYIVPCPDSVAPPFVGSAPGLFYKYPPFVQYSLFSKQQNQLCFFLDSLFYGAPKGRYVADLFVNEVYCSSLRLNYKRGCRIQSFSSQSFGRNPCADMEPSPACPTATCA